MIAFLVLEGLMIGVFTALDLVLFYLFFEAGPDPDVPDHRHLGAARTASMRPSSSSSTPSLGSVLMLVAMIAMYRDGWDHRYPSC